MAVPPHLFVVTGIPASGKSTVGAALARRFPRGVHLRGDQYRRAVVSGREEMTPVPSAEALAQLRLRHELAAASADRFVEAGFTVVLQDVFLGEYLPFVIGAIRTRPLHVVVLCPSPEEVLRREAARSKSAYGELTAHALDAVLRDETPPVGLWLDSTAATVDATVDEILARAMEAELA